LTLWATGVHRAVLKFPVREDELLTRLTRRARADDTPMRHPTSAQRVPRANRAADALLPQGIHHHRRSGRHRWGLHTGCYELTAITT